LHGGGASPAGASGGPEEQVPQPPRPRVAAVTKTPPTRRLRPGDLICGECGEGNPPIRKFCSRCGNSLLESEIVKTPWWRKLLPHRGPKVVAVAPGEHAAHRGVPGIDVRHGFRKLRRRAAGLVAIAVGVAALAYAIVPSMRTAVNGEVATIKNDIFNNIPQYDPIHPDRVVANGHEAGHPSRLAFDSFYNTYWLARWHSAHLPTLTLTFNHPVNLNQMILYSGDNANYTAYSRPSALHLIFSNGHSETLNPKDTSQKQTLGISNATKVNSVQIQVTAIYPGNPHRHDVAISDVEFFGFKV
jgi:hypothetical protein